ncbi:hypothetical protein RSAG8_11161, partial [Rhizoctonia solani AG-8 WAC10335]
MRSYHMCYPLRYYFLSFYPILYSTGRLIGPGSNIPNVSFRIQLNRVFCGLLYRPIISLYSIYLHS